MIYIFHGICARYPIKKGKWDEIIQKLYYPYIYLLFRYVIYTAGAVKYCTTSITMERSVSSIVKPSLLSASDFKQLMHVPYREKQTTKLLLQTTMSLFSYLNMILDSKMFWCQEPILWIFFIVISAKTFSDQRMPNCNVYIVNWDQLQTTGLANENRNG